MKSLFSVQLQRYLHSSNEMQFKIKIYHLIVPTPFSGVVLTLELPLWVRRLVASGCGHGVTAVSSISLGGEGCCWCWFFLLSPGSGVRVILMLANICTLLFPHWSVIACYVCICVFNIHYMLILCSLSLLLELVLPSCKGFFPLISNDWPVLSCV